MESSKSLVSLLLVGILIGFMSQCQAYDFYVGGRDGSWVLNPSESYNHWGQRNRFQVNDKLVFKYNKLEDSVLVVKKEDYDACNTTNPIQRLDGGDSVFQFDRWGHFFFISGAPGRCEKGEKMVVVVLAVRNNKKTPPPASSPSSPLHPSPSEPPISRNPDGSSTGRGFAPAPAPSSSQTASSSSSIFIAARVSLGLVGLTLSVAFFI